MSKRKLFSLFWLVSLTLVSVSCGPLNQIERIVTPTQAPDCQFPCASDSLTLTAARAEDYTATAAAASLPTVTDSPASDSLTLTAARAEDYTATAAAAASLPAVTDSPASDSLTMTVAMGATLRAIPTKTPLPWATILPSADDLGWGSVSGRILDGVTFAPLAGASVRCEQVPPSPYPCQGSTLTNEQGLYTFIGVFFRQTDRVILYVEAPGYTPLRFEQGLEILPELHADLALEPVLTSTATLEPIIMCTPPACEGGQLTCGQAAGCPGGCGTVCQLPTP